MTGLPSAVSSWPRRVLVFSIEAYRAWISPMRMPSCRFEPTCSAYAVEAITEWGATRGAALSIWRLAKCGPWHRPGYDPVPERDGRGPFANRHHGSDTSVSPPPDATRLAELNEERMRPC